MRQATVDQARALEEVLARTDLPRVFVQSSVFARGSGANPSGVLRRRRRMDSASIARTGRPACRCCFRTSSISRACGRERPRPRHRSRASTALYDEALLTITNEQQTAAALLQTTRAIAANTPVQLAAAQQSESQARARYDAGLASIIEVADAQSLLAQAEVQDQLARVDVWRALLAAAVAQGDLTSFVNLVRQP